MRLNSALWSSHGKQKSWKKLTYEFRTLHWGSRVQFPKDFIYMNGLSLLGNQGMVLSTLTREETEIQRRRVV